MDPIRALSQVAELLPFIQDVSRFIRHDLPKLAVARMLGTEARGVEHSRILDCSRRQGFFVLALTLVTLGCPQPPSIGTRLDWGTMVTLIERDVLDYDLWWEESDSATNASSTPGSVVGGLGKRCLFTVA